MTISKKDVLDYLNVFGTKVRKNESDSYVELMMDNHKCINYDGKLYYIPDSFTSDYQVNMFDYLVENYLY